VEAFALVGVEEQLFISAGTSKSKHCSPVYPSSQWHLHVRDSRLQVAAVLEMEQTSRE
jgi:hypothetical protein